MSAFIDGPAGRLEIREECRAEAPRALAVVAHPHPLFGGTMDNKVVYTLARAAQDQSCVSLRFNFRGVGRSEGSHDKGTGEVEDLATVLAHGRERYPDLPVVLAGFSFGAFISLMLAMREAPLALITIAPPLNYLDAGEIHSPQCDWLLVHGDADDVVDCETTRTLAGQLDPPPEIQIVPDVGHFFHGHIVDLGDRVQRWLAPRLPS